MGGIKKDYYETKLAERAAGIINGLHINVKRRTWGKRATTGERVYSMAFELTTPPEKLEAAILGMKGAFRRAKVYQATLPIIPGDPPYPVVYLVLKNRQPKKRA